METLANKLRAAGINILIEQEKLNAILPMYYFDDDPIEVYIHPILGTSSVKLSDEGYINMLHDYRYELKETIAREEYKKLVCKTYHLQYDDATGEYYRIIQYDYILPDIWVFAQGLHSLADMVNHIGKSKVRSKMVEEIKDWFRSEFSHPILTARVDYTFTEEPDDELNPCDIVLNGVPNIKPIVFEIVSSADRAQEACQVLLHHIYKKDRKIRSVIIFTDYDKLPLGSTTFKRLLNLGAQTYNDVPTAISRINDMIEHIPGNN